MSPIEQRTASGRLLCVIPDVTWWRVNEKFEHGFCLTPAFRDDVGIASGKSADNYGRHTAGLELYVRGPAGAVQFKMYTGWNIEDVEGDRWTRERSNSNLFPMAVDFGWHLRLPDDYQPSGDYEFITDECPVIDGAKCSYDGSGLNAEPVMELLVRDGHAAVYEYLERYYRFKFDDDGDWPMTRYEVGR